MLTIENISYFLSEKLLFNNLTLTILPHAIINIQGPNGAGKTTLLRIIAGLIKAKKGNIKFLEQDILILPKPYCIYLGHSTSFKEDLTVLENITFWAKLYNSLQNIELAINYFQLSDILYKQYYQLSAGQKQRATIAKIIICKSNLWLLDEVDTHLDKYNLNLLNELIIKKANEGGIILFTSHNNSINHSTKLYLNEYSDV